MTDSAKRPWRSVPPPRPVRPPRPPALPAIVAASLPLAMQFRQVGYPPEWSIRAVVLVAVALVASRLTPKAAPAVWAVLVLLLSGFVPGSVGTPKGAVFVLGFALAWGAVTGAVSRRDGSQLAGPVRAALVALIPASVLLALRPGLLLPAVLTALALMWVAVVALRPAASLRLVTALTPKGARVEAIRRGVIVRTRSVGHRARELLLRVLTVVLLLPAATFTLLLWAFQRLLRLDVLVPGGSKERAWWRRLDADRHPDRLYPSPSFRAVQGAGVRARRAGVLLTSALAAAIVVVVVVVPVAWLLRAGSDSDSASAGDPVPEVFAGEPWYPQLRAELSDVVTPGQGNPWDALGPRRVRDVRSEYVNVADGVRASWAPPPCDCPRLRVWMYGGSSLFGVMQRDEHTIASELARRAWEEGVALEVSNRGLPGDTAWQEVNRFAADLAAEEPPDAVVFYDGYNDVWASYIARDQGRLDDPRPVDPMGEELLRSVEGSLGSPGDLRSDMEVLDRGERSSGAASSESIGRAAVRRYEAARSTASRLAASYGVDAFWFWQPNRFSRPQVEGEPVSDADDFAQSQQAYLAAVSALPPAVVSLDAVFDDTSTPVFFDDVHTGEAGARIVAASMSCNLLPVLTGSAGHSMPDREGPTCN